MIRQLAALAGLASIAACSGGGSAGDYCVGSFQGGTSEFACTACSGVDPFDEDTLAPARDNDGDSYRRIGLGEEGTITMRFRAPEDLSFPSGVDAGALLRFQDGANLTASFSLYNGSTPVAASSGSSIANASTPADAGNDHYYAVTPVSTFDRLDLTVSANGSPVTFRLYEVCGDR